MTSTLSRAAAHLRPALLLALTAAAGAAQAQLLVPQVVDSGCLDGITDTCIVETSTTYQGLPAVQYGITNNQSQGLWGFGVTNGAAGIAATNVSSWWGTYVTRAQWDAGVTFAFQGDNTVLSFATPRGPTANSLPVFHTWRSGEQPDGETTGTYLGSYDSLFGADAEDGVAFYWNRLQGNALYQGASANGFYLTRAVAASNFATFNYDGQVVTQSPAAPVPEPGTTALMLAGLGLVGWAGRRRMTRRAD